MLLQSDTGQRDGYAVSMRGAALEAHTPHAQKRSPTRVMLIEDDDDIREALDALLCSVGYETRCFARADVAFRGLDRERPDIILLDLMMPGMNGWQFRVEMKKHPTLSETPIVVLTADASAYAAAIDASAFLTKPVDIEELQRVIDRVLVANERRRLAARAMELERVRSLGMLVASVAHEVNNPLTYVLGCLDLAGSDVHELSAFAAPANTVTPNRSAPAADARISASSAAPPGTQPPAALVQRLRGNIDAAFDGAQRVAATVKLISTFARAESDAPSGRVDVVRAAKAAARLAQHQIEPRAKLVVELAALPEAAGNEGRLAQVILNLLVNAGQAIPAETTRAHEVCLRGFVVGDELRLEVTDTGTGIPNAVLKDIFEPFFTTKPPGQGTGLGLSISREIVNEMGGTLSAESSLGAGSTFRISLPVLAPRESQLPGAPGLHPQPRDEHGGGSLRVLVIDDELLIGKFVQAALPSDHVEFIVDPREALSRAGTLAFDVILCDLRMPAMSGIALFHALVAIRPELQRIFVLMSGASADSDLETFLKEHHVAVLRKPFPLQKLRALIAERRAQARP